MTDTDILAFLKARLDEDERRARAAGWHSWSVNDGRVLAGNGKVVAEPGRDYDAAHIALHDPSRVLREVAAKRRRLGRHEGLHRCEGGDFEGGPYGPCEPVLELASIWSDHPDCNPSWRMD